jgi:hypothetical protein
MEPLLLLDNKNQNTIELQDRGRALSKFKLERYVPPQSKDG